MYYKIFLIIIKTVIIILELSNMESSTKINDTYYTNEEILIEQSSDEKPKKPFKNIRAVKFDLF
jgi:hypothetical protein